jgi:hypothetical protein
VPSSEFPANANPPIAATNSIIENCDPFMGPSQESTSPSLIPMEKTSVLASSPVKTEAEKLAAAAIITLGDAISVCEQDSSENHDLVSLEDNNVCAHNQKQNTLVINWSNDGDEEVSQQDAGLVQQQVKEEMEEDSSDVHGMSKNQRKILISMLEQFKMHKSSSLFMKPMKLTNKLYFDVVKR